MSANVAGELAEAQFANWPVLVAHGVAPVTREAVVPRKLFVAPVFTFQPAGNPEKMPLKF